MENFKDSGLNESVLQAIGALGFETPTPVQAQALPLILEAEKDLIALARTGTGKTGGFGLPLINDIDPDTKAVQALVLCPTRELCLQIARDFKSYAKFSKGVKITAIYGGAPVGEQIRSLENGAQVVVGTPGRTLDLIKRKKLKVAQISRLVLDEADEMLNMGFQEELDEILAATPAEKQTLLFSATMPKEARRMAKKYMHEPNEISVGHQDAGNSKVVHRYYQVKSADRFRLLQMLVELEPDIYAVIFCRTRREVDNIAHDLRAAGLNTAPIHGELSQAQRDDVMGRFRRRQINVLVATDVAARGLDVQDLTHVINYQLPDAPEVYVHRSGRTGRAGKEGIAIAIINGREKRKIQAIEKHTGISFEQAELPTADEVYQTKVLHYAQRALTHQSEDPKLRKVIQEEVAPLFAGLSKGALLEQLMGLALADLSQRYAGNSPLKDDKAPERVAKRKDISYTRLCIRMGKAHGLTTNQLIGMLNRRVASKRVAIGKVDIQKNLSFFDVDAQAAQEVVKALTGVVDKGVELNVQVYGEGEAAGSGFKGRRNGRNGADFKKGRSGFKKNFDKKKKGLKKGKW
ncbi:MAG: DEAD/DEAH box helicase [Bacteroidota bacterium]